MPGWAWLWEQLPDYKAEKDWSFNNNTPALKIAGVFPVN